MTNLVVGGTGFIGSSLVSALKKQGEPVCTLSKKGIGTDGESVVFDLVEERIPPRIVQGVHTIFYLAGISHDTSDSKLINIYQELNVNAPVRLAKLAGQHGVKRFIFVSSVKAGGEFQEKGCCYSEDDEGFLSDIYGKTKRMAELELLSMKDRVDMSISIIRPSVVYGPNMKGNLRLMLSGVKGGWFPPLPKNNSVKSLIHVDDLVDAMLLIAKSNKSKGRVFIVTDGVKYTPRDIYDIMRNLSGKPVSSFFIPEVLFNFISLLSPSLKRKVEKLLGDECYISERMASLGFKARKTLYDLNKTDY